MGGMSGGKGGQAPSAPDFAGAANAQANSGHINQNGPFGSTGWTQGPDGRYTQNTQLAGGLGQGAGNLENQIGNQGPLDNGSTVRQQAIDASYNQAASRLNPQWSQADESFRQQMANQGLDPGSQAFDNARGNFDRSRNDAYTSAMNNAISNGNQAQALTFNENLQAQNNPYQQLGMLNGLTSGMSGQGTQTQYLPAAMQAYQGALQNYGIQQQGKNSAMSGLGGLAGLGALAL